MHNVYCFRERLTGTYTMPEYRFEQPEDLAKGYERFCIINPAKAYEQHFNELELYYLGTFDDEKARFQLLEEPMFVQDFGPICEQSKRRLENASNPS